MAYEFGTVLAVSEDQVIYSTEQGAIKQVDSKFYSGNISRFFKGKDVYGRFNKDMQFVESKN
jgi:hypothetical protein